jgi:hypothetical protein
MISLRTFSLVQGHLAEFEKVVPLTSIFVKCEYSTFPSWIFQFSLTIINNLFNECFCTSLDSLLRGSSSGIYFIDSG